LSSIFADLASKSTERGYEFLVIGAHALNAHGYARTTADLDLLARATERAGWKEIMASLGYKLDHEHSSFSQFSTTDEKGWPIDIMFVNERSFAGMIAESFENPSEKEKFRVPSFEHVVALKLHALKHSHPGRHFKDLLDIVNLVEVKKVDMYSEPFRKLCEKYGPSNALDQIIAASG
jgi:hypothetical protein